MPRATPRPSHPPNAAAAVELESRELAVLKVLARDHVASGEPVSSARIARLSGLHLSPASIRGIMARLEREGLLEQPHASAGRVPTERGWRVFVDEMLGRPQRVAPEDALSIERALGQSGETSELLGAASRELSALSRQLGVVLAPALSRIVVERLQFLRLDGRRVAAILVGRGGTVHHRTLVVAAALAQEELERVGRYLSERYGGRTLVEMREALERHLGQEREALGRLQAAGLELCTAAVGTADADIEVFVEGASNLLATPAFADLDIARALFHALDQKRVLVELLDGLIHGTGVQVRIGAENPLSEHARCAIVASTWGSAGRVLGTVGIVGPLRMEYSRLIPLVEYFARTLSGRLDEARN